MTNSGAPRSLLIEQPAPSCPAKSSHPDYQNLKIDDLVLLLSTDWFLPYWPEIEIHTNEDKKLNIQLGCQEIVSQILGDANDYFHCDLSPERKQETYSRFKTLLRTAETENDFSRICQEWAILSHRELTASFSLWLATLDIVHGLNPEKSASLDSTIVAVVHETWTDPEPNAHLFLDLCWKSMTSWDANIRNILGSPTALSSTLKSIFRYKRCIAFFAQLRLCLTHMQRKQLSDWYRETGNSRSKIIVPALSMIQADPRFPLVAKD